jgi:ribosomal protein S18 acetylase RimI-like enzyme
MNMAVTYFRRYRMQIDLREGFAPPDESPPGYSFLPWSKNLLAAHAEAKFRSFRNELDANVFRCLGIADGCHRLMKEITRREQFVPEATWLVRYTDPKTGRVENAGTVQGIRTKADVGSIQNIGIVPAHRGNQLGGLIVQHALKGFELAGVRFVRLEVTVHNTAAIRLYQRLGFRILRTVYKSADVIQP